MIRKEHRCPKCNEILHLHSIRNDLMACVDRNVYCPVPSCDVVGPHSSLNEEDALRLFYGKYPRLQFSQLSDPESWDVDADEIYTEVYQRLETGM